jgi:hypothetical protein
MKTEYKVSVNILNWNRKDMLYEVLKSFGNQTFKDFEIVVVDNNSDDGSPQMILDEFPDVKLIQMPKNTGVPGGRNIGIVNSLGEILFFIDNDAIPDENLLEILVESFESDTSIGVIGAKILNFYTKEIDITSWVYGKHNLKDRDKKFDASMFVGCGFAVRREVFEEVGLFSDYFFFMSEEKDLCYRVLDKGYKIIYNPEIVVSHKISPEKRYEVGERFYRYGFRNEIWILWKYYPWLSAIKNTINSILISFPYSIKRKAFGAYIQGFFSTLKGLPFVIKQRQKVKPETIKRFHALLNTPKTPWLDKVRRFISKE